MLRWYSILGILIFTFTLFVCTCGDDDDDDDSGSADPDCIICSTTSECTDAMGPGWVCQGGCCEDMDPDDDDDDGDDDDAVDDYGLEWVSIKGGWFKMGCAQGDTDCQADENPNHNINISDFEMTATEINQEQFESITNLTPSFNTECGDCPVEQVTWEQASTFCMQVDGRLPFEAEWEYAARAGTLTKYYCGESPTCLLDTAWFADNGNGTTHPVGAKEPNAFGLYDMHGNVFEWVFDWYGLDYYEYSPDADPPGPPDGTQRVLRGGAFSSDGWGLRASYRYSAAPEGSSKLFGFRCVRGIAGGDDDDDDTSD